MGHTFQPLRCSMVSTRAASFLYSTKMRMRLVRDLWCLASKPCSLPSFSCASTTSTVCGHPTTSGDEMCKEAAGLGYLSAHPVVSQEIQCFCCARLLETSTPQGALVQRL